MAQNNIEILNYYKRVQPLIEQYKNVWNIEPINLSRYLKREKLESFIARHNLSDVPNIHDIISDIIDDILLDDKRKLRELESKEDHTPVNSEIDKIKENLDGNITHSDMDVIKQLADFFNTSIALIVSLGDSKYKVSSLGEKEFECYAYTMSDLKEYKKELVSKAYDEIDRKLKESKHILSFHLETFNMGINVMEYIDFSLLELNLKQISPNDTAKILMESKNLIYLGKTNHEMVYHIFKQK